MKAIRVENLATKPEVKLTDVPKPEELQRDEVLVRVLCIGLDGTDRDILTEHYGTPPEGDTGLTTGHESLGVVAKAGEDSGLRPGDLVTALVRRPCRDPECVNCRNGHADYCETGKYVERGIKGAHGYLAEYYKEESRYVVKVPRDCMAYGMLAEPQSIVEKVWDQVQNVQQRLIWEPKTALVLGSGPLGLLAALTCRLLGLETHVWSLTPADSVQAGLVRGCGAMYHQAGGGADKQAAGGGAGAGNAADRAKADADGGAAGAKAGADGGGAAGAKAGADGGVAGTKADADGGGAGAKAGTGSGAAIAAGPGTLTGFASGLGKHIDLIWECTGYSPLAFEAMGALGPNGVLALLGVTPGQKTETLPIDKLNMNMVLENKCVIGSVNAARKDFETGLYRLQQMHERFPDVLAGIVTDRLRLEDVPGIDFAKFAIKAVVDVVPVEQWAGLVKQTADVAYSFSV